MYYYPKPLFWWKHVVGNHQVLEKQDVDLSVIGDLITAKAWSLGRIIHTWIKRSQCLNLHCLVLINQNKQDILYLISDPMVIRELMCRITLLMNVGIALAIMYIYRSKMVWVHKHTRFYDVKSNFNKYKVRNQWGLFALIYTKNKHKYNLCIVQK